MIPSHDPLTAAYHPEAFRALAHGVVDRLADHLAAMDRREGPVLPWRSPSEACEAWPPSFPAAPTVSPLALLDQVLEQSHHLHHPRFVGHQVSSPLPWSALLDFAGALLNNGSAIYEMGPASTAMERAVAQWFAARAGWDASRADGFLTHGGSAGNLTALLAARQHAAPWNVWEEGLRGGGDLCILTSDQAHYSVRRSAQVMGLGARAVVALPTDDRFRLRPAALAEALRRERSAGRTVLAVVASAGSTATGAIDPLEDIAELCRNHGTWLHVDAAHGGGLLVSDRLKGRLAGLEGADSVVIDAHKMLMAPALATLVLFREGGRSFESFSQSASYLFDGADPRDTWFDLAQRTLECTKRSLGLQVYASLQALGTDLFAAYVERMVNLTASFAGLLRARPLWEIATEPEANILCFRHAPPGLADADAFQDRARNALVQEGSFYLVRTRLAGKTWLRSTLINPRTELSDLEALLERVEREAATLISLPERPC